MKKIFERISDEEILYNLNKTNNISRGTLIEIHIADLHFGALDPKYQYDVLSNQFLSKISTINFNILSINGDLFDRKTMANSDVVLYASLFIDQLVNICRQKNATLIIILGTESHDSNQLKIFYHYLYDPSIDIRIVENVRFEYVHGAKILCIPELYGNDKAFYDKYLLYSGLYDSAFMHGTIEGAVYNNDKEDCIIKNDKAPVFNINNFRLCTGPILSGHVHTPGCYNSYFYYCGSPYRWTFGQEEEKGFLIVLHNLDTGSHYVHLEPITSYRYDTIDIDEMIKDDPQNVINYIDDLHKQGIDFIRLKLNRQLYENEKINMDVLKNYYRNSRNTKIAIKENGRESISQQQFIDQNKEYAFIMDKTMNDYDKLAKYINMQQNYIFITGDEIKKIVLDETF